MCPHCKTKESFFDRMNAIFFRRCRCGAEFYYPVTMNFALLFVLIISMNVVPDMKNWNFALRALFFITIYYVSIFLFDITGIFKRKFKQK